MTKRNTKLLYQQASITLCKIALFLQQLEERGETYHGTTQETAQGKHLQPYEKSDGGMDDAYRVTNR
jgi:hypothetical protein